MTIQSIEEEFDEKFSDGRLTGQVLANGRTIKSFYRTEIRKLVEEAEKDSYAKGWVEATEALQGTGAEAQEQLRKELKEKIVLRLRPAEEALSGYDIGWDRALDEVLKLID